MRLRAAIIADDLTGACDASVPFAAGGLSTLVSVEALPSEPGAEAVSVSTETRDAAADEAAARVGGVVLGVVARRPELIYKKVDSLLRGPVGAELAAAREAAGAPYVVLAPALPRLARTVADGVVADPAGRRIRVAERLASSSSLRSVTLAAGSSGDELASRFEHAAADGPDVLVCDAESAAHLRAVARALLSLRPAPLAAGAADLAWALARELGLEPPPGRQPCPRAERVLFVLGSLDARLRRQLRVLLAERPMPCLSVEEVAAGVKAPAGAPALVLESLLGSNGGPDGGATAARLAWGVRTICARDRFDALVCSGGAVAAGVCRAFGVAALAPACELAPGFVVSYTQLPTGPPLLAARSGSFGADADLRDAYDRLTAGAG